MGTDQRLLDRMAGKFTVSDGCWEWTAGKNNNGYGQIAVANRGRGAHVVLYELLVGPVPDGLELDHLCRNPGCVRPGHLEPVTHQENMRRRVVSPGSYRGNANGGTDNAAKTHCPHGHLYDEARDTDRMRSLCSREVACAE